MANTKITSRVIADDAVTTAAIADDAITQDQIADNAVGTAQLKFTATGGTITTAGGYTIHTFTSSGTFNASKAGTVEYLVIAGGGGGGSTVGGGGGAGGYRATGYGPSPLRGSAVSGLETGTYTITVGAGGVDGPNSNGRGANGTDSSIAFPSTIT